MSRTNDLAIDITDAITSSLGLGGTDQMYFEARRKILDVIESRMAELHTSYTLTDDMLRLVYSPKVLEELVLEKQIQAFVGLLVKNPDVFEEWRYTDVPQALRTINRSLLVIKPNTNRRFV